MFNFCEFVNISVLNRTFTVSEQYINTTFFSMIFQLILLHNQHTIKVLRVLA